MSYIDTIIRIKNAQAIKAESIKVPYSNMDMAVLDALTKSRYIEGAVKKGRMPKRVIEIKLKYDNSGQGVINGIKLISKPSRRLYSASRDLRAVKSNYGIGIISTSKGIMSYSEARRAKVGGQLLFEIW